MPWKLKLFVFQFYYSNSDYLETKIEKLVNNNKKTLKKKNFFLLKIWKAIWHNKIPFIKKFNKVIIKEKII